MEPERAIATIRESVVAVMRVRPVRPTQFEVGFVGTAFCVVANKLFVTTHHVFNNQQPRRQSDKFYVFSVPHNGARAHYFPVVNFPYADPALDFALIETGPGNDDAPDIPGLPFRTSPVADGARVVTCGFPAPVVNAANLAADGTFLGGGQFFLKSHANEGIVSAQYEFSGHRIFEFNVGWFNGESGGPVVLQEDGSVVAVMQSYRNIQAPHGTVAGPHLGRPLALIADTLIASGAIDVAAHAEAAALANTVQRPEGG